MKIRVALELIVGLVMASVFVVMGLVVILIGVLILAGADAMDVEPSLRHRLSGLPPLGFGFITVWAACNGVREMRNERRAERLVAERSGTEPE